MTINENWNLDEIYTGYESEDFIKDTKEIKKIVDSLNNFISINLHNYDEFVEVAETCLKLFQNYELIYSKLETYIKLTMSVNTNDSEASSAFYSINEINSNYIPLKVKFQNYLSKIDDINVYIDKSSFLKQHEYVFKEMLNNSKYLLNENEEKIISNLRITGSSSWQNLQNKVSSNLKVNKVDSYSEDKESKKKRFKKELEAYKTHEEVSAACLNSIKGEAIAIARLKKFDSPMHKSMVDCRMDVSIINSLFSSIESYLPKLRMFLKTKAKIMGYSNGLPYYEVSSPIGFLNRKYSLEEAKEIILHSFYDFDVTLGDYAKRAFDGSWIDYKPKDGKVGGGFCSYIHQLGQSRILVNYNGTINDVITIAHELGHGFHGSLLYGESILNTYYPIPVAEIASTFSELLVTDKLLKDADEKLKFSFFNNSINRSIQLTIDILSRYYFESEVFLKRTKGDLSAEEINQCMLDAQKKSYADGLDNSYLNKYMWLNKEHYYYVDRSYYNFSYAFGFLLSVGFYDLYRKNKSNFVRRYYDFLKSSGKATVIDLCHLMDINPCTNEFWNMSLDVVVKDIEEFIQLSEISEDIKNE